MTPTEETFRALARSAPWRFTSLHFTWRRQPGGGVECWLSRPGRLRVRDSGRVHVVTDEAGAPAEEPVLRPDGLVASRPRACTHDIGDPLWDDYRFVSLLDPEELSEAVSLSDLRSEPRAGRETWWARAVPEEGYEPRCGCCPLLWSRISDRDEYAEDDLAWEPPAGTVYPVAYEIGLDVQTAVVVSLSPVGECSLPGLGFETTIHSVDPPEATGW